MINTNEILSHITKDGEIKVHVLYGDQNIWLTQKMLARQNLAVAETVK